MNFNLSGTFADELLQETEARVKTRGYKQEELDDTAIPVEYDPVFDDTLSVFREILRMSSHVDYRKTLQSNNSLKGRIKKILYKFFAWFVVPALEAQNGYNQIIIDVMENMSSEIELLKCQIEELKSIQE